MSTINHHSLTYTENPHIGPRKANVQTLYVTSTLLKHSAPLRIPSFYPSGPKYSFRAPSLRYQTPISTDKTKNPDSQSDIEMEFSFKVKLYCNSKTTRVRLKSYILFLSNIVVCTQHSIAFNDTLFLRLLGFDILYFYKKLNKYENIPLLSINVSAKSVHCQPRFTECRRTIFYLLIYNTMLKIGIWVGFSLSVS
jgi:hypothetical protein